MAGCTWILLLPHRVWPTVEVVDYRGLTASAPASACASAPASLSASRAVVHNSTQGLVLPVTCRHQALRLIRRVALKSRQLGAEGPIGGKLVPVVMDLARGAYPEVVEKEDLIVETFEREEVSWLLLRLAGCLDANLLGACQRAVWRCVQ